MVILVLAAAAAGFAFSEIRVGRHRATPARGPAQVAATVRSKPAFRPSAARAASSGVLDGGGQAPSAEISPEASALADAIDTLTSSKAGFLEEQALWDRLRQAGQIGTLIASLQKLEQGDPNDPAIATALGEAEIEQIRVVAEGGGGDPSEIPLLALQADQQFSAALKLDPSNWEAQYDKAASMSRWPAALQKGPEVIQRLTALAAQQESMAPSPDFAQTYLLLGQLYAASGNSGQAMATWQRGLSLFPANTALMTSLSHGAASP